jgi:signal peptidase II
MRSTSAVTTTARPTRVAPILRAVAVMAIVVIADRITKHLVRAHIEPGHSVHVFSWLHLVHDENNGVAFGFLSGGGALVVIVTAAVALVLLAYFLRAPRRPWLWLSTGLLVGGAIGNLLDRLISGSVTDFIKLPHWPAFNVSDIAITIGVISLVLVLEGPAPRARP